MTTNTAPTFSLGTGKVQYTLGTADNRVASVIQQADGQLVVAGYSHSATDVDFGLIRLNPFSGAPDTGFGVGGKLLVSVGPGDDFGQCAIQQADGKLVVAGWSTASNGAPSDFSLVRLLPDGTLDPSFGNAGKLVLPVGNAVDSAYSLIQQSDGKLVVAGTSGNGSTYFDFSLIRLLPDGTLDTSFDGDGKLLIPMASEFDYVRCVIQQPDGKLVLVGTSDNGHYANDFRVTRLLADGSLDTGFGTGGSVVLPAGSGVGQSATGIVLADGKLLVAGSCQNGATYDFTLIRLRADGSLDTTFDADGKLMIPVGVGADFCTDVIQTSDGKLVLAGYSFNGVNNEVSLVRLHADGTLDTSFDGDGKLTIDVSSGNDQAYSLIQQDNGKLVVAGNNVGQGDVTLIRLNADGSLDTTLGSGGPNTLGNAVAYTENASPVLIDTSVVLIDTELSTLNSGSGNYAGASVTVSRQSGANAQDVLAIDAAGASFTLSGTNLQSGGQTFATVDSTGSTLSISFTGSATAATQALVNDVLSHVTYANTSDAPPASVTLAWTFNDGNTGAQGTGGALSTMGTSTVNITATNDAPTGDVTITGTAHQGQTLTASNTLTDADGLGSISYQWLRGGNAIDGATGGSYTVAAADVGQSVSVRASYTDGGGTTESVTSSATSNVPTPNTASGFTYTPRTGTVSLDMGAAQSLTLQSGDKLVLGGTSGSNGILDFSVVRLNADGSLDTSFSGDGKAVIDLGSSADYANSVVVQSDGKLVLAGYSTNSSGSSDFSAVRLNANGSLDTTFSGDGKTVIDLGGSDQAESVVVQPDGKLVLVGGSFSTVINSDIGVVRLNADGTLDTTFSGDGQVVIDLGSNYDFANSVVVLSDGKLVLGGGTSNVYGAGNREYSVLRLNADGSLDTSFSGDGKAEIEVIGIADAALSMVVQSDGKLVLGGYSYSSGSNYDFSIVRLNTDGTLDTSFSDDGKAVIDLGGSPQYDYAYSVVVQPDGKLVLAGTTGVVRLNADGSLDTTFSGDGISTAATGIHTVKVLADGKLVLGSLTSVTRLNAEGSLDTAFGDAVGGGSVNTLGGSVAYTENASPVLIDTSVVLIDPELSALNGGTGNYAGASVTLSRQSGANAQDVLAIDESGASFTLSGTNLQSGGQTFGTVSSTGSTLSISFTGGATAATQALVNDVLSHVTYANTSDAPPASVQIAWTFNDGNTGSQGTGGALTATGTTTVNITPTNDAPVITVVPDQPVHTTLGQVVGLTGITVADPDGRSVPLNVELTASNGSIAGLVDANPALRGIQLTGTAAQINDALSMATFTAAGAGAASIGIRVTDGLVASPVEASYQLLVTEAVNTRPTFVAAGTGGKVFIDVSGQDDAGASLVQQADGKLVLAGFGGAALNADFCVSRLNADGSIDTTFGNNGSVVIAVGAERDQAFSVMQQADGKLVVAGLSYNGANYDTSVVRLNADGSLDTSFGQGGKLIVPVGNDASMTWSVIEVAGGQLVLAGYSQNASGQSNYDYSLLRLNANGSVDTAFGRGGVVTVPIGSGNDEAFRVIQQADGKLVLAGVSHDPDSLSNHTSLVRLNANGSLDASFGDGGKLIVPVSSTDDRAWSVMQQADGKLVMVGYSASAGTGSDFSAVRLNPDGSLDSSFGTLGKVIIPVSNAADAAWGIVQQPDGKLILGGYTQSASTGYDYSAVRLHTDGSLDTSFGTDGKAIVPVGMSSDFAYSLILQSDGKLVLAGESVVGSGVDFSAVRLNADGSLDTTFNAHSTLDSVVNFTTGGSPVVLDGSVVVTDAELSSLNARAGLFAGASITLARAGGAVAEDVFSGSGNLSFSGGNAMLSGVSIGSVSNSAGTLSITFNVNATQAKVNETLSAIAYANTSGTPPANVQIAWTFSDGNAGAQGSGGALTATGTTTVHITDVGHSIGGTAGADTQTGNTGNDTLSASAGNDSLNGGAGTDTVDFSQETAPVSVILYGNQSHGLSIGVDTLTAIENIVGSQFNDLVYGDLGNNLIQGGLGQDTLDGAEGHDTLQGQTGDDLLNGLAGNDSLEGGEGNDSIYGWADLDTLVGGLGDDRLFGGAQADVLDGGDGADNLEGDDGNDTLTGAVGNDTLRGWNDNDSMDGGDGDDALFGGAGADVMLGGVGTDNLEGDDGNDTIAGGTGNDTLRGWNDNDSLDGGDGNDLVVGWSGNDSLVGGLGDDSLFGDDGADTLVGGTGGDVLQGGMGNDLYLFDAAFGFDGVRDYDYTAGNSDTFQFNGVNLAELSFARVGDALKVERTASAGVDVIYVNDWYMAGSNGAYKIESWIMGDGSYTAAQIEALVV